MAEESFEEKTEQPTPKKREEVRKKGQVAKSKELSSVAVLFSALITLTIFGSYMYNQVTTVITGSFSSMTLKELTIPEFTVFAQNKINVFILTLAPLWGGVVLAAVLSNIMQVGFMFSAESIKPKFSKLDPFKGFGRMFSKQSLMELFKSLSKLAIVGGVGYLAIKSEMDDVFVMAEMELTSIVAFMLTAILKISTKVTLAMIFLVVIDYAFQKWEFEKKIKMTKKEVKDEHKRSEGDPLIKQRIRSIQMQMARKRMMQSVPDADVVITNPTHLAVALKYDPATMTAPKLLAKGAEGLARRIKELAEEHDIPIVENKPLAHSLYASVEIGQEVPSDLYQAVAEVLAYIYKLKGSSSSAQG